jgi:hypothetical protein
MYSDSQSRRVKAQSHLTLAGTAFLTSPCGEVARRAGETREAFCAARCSDPNSCAMGVGRNGPSAKVSAIGLKPDLPWMNLGVADCRDAPH